MRSWKESITLRMQTIGVLEQRFITMRTTSDKQEVWGLVQNGSSCFSFGDVYQAAPAIYRSFTLVTSAVGRARGLLTR